MSNARKQAGDKVTFGTQEQVRVRRNIDVKPSSTDRHLSYNTRKRAADKLTD